jgi:hypothetical protein
MSEATDEPLINNPLFTVTTPELVHPLGKLVPAKLE